MEKVLHGPHWKSLLLYLNDIIVRVPDLSTRHSRLKEVVNQLRKPGLKLNPFKCELLQSQMRYFRHIVSKDGVATDPKKVEAVRELPTRANLKQSHALLGIVG